MILVSRIKRVVFSSDDGDFHILALAHGHVAIVKGARPPKGPQIVFHGRSERHPKHGPRLIVSRWERFQKPPEAPLPAELARRFQDRIDRG